MKFPLVLMALLMTANVTTALEPIRAVLNNGMIVIIKEDHSAPVVSLHMFIRAGSIYEGEYLGRGISHFLEHLLDSGTKKRTKEEINRIIEEIGNVSNAYTTKDHTSYYITTASSYFDVALDVLSDCIKNVTFPESEVEAERGVILNEINMHKDDPESELYELLMSTMFRIHPAGIPTIGFADQFVKTSRDDIFKYYKRMYVPNNMVFVVVGDIDSSVALEKIKSAFSDFERGNIPDFKLPDEPKQVSKRRVEKEMDIQVAYMLMGFRTVDVFHKDQYPLDVMAFILGEGMSSRLYKKIKDEKQLVYGISVWSSTPAYKDGGYFAIMSELSPDKIEEAESAILEEIYKLKNEYVTEAELEKAKNLKESNYVFSQQTMEDQAETLGSDELATGDMNYSKRYLKGISSVTKEDIMRVANEYFYDDNLTIAIVRPKREVKKVISGEEGSKTSEVSKFTLENGIKLLVKENNNVPVVAMQAIFLGGVRFENEENNGISNFMSNMLIKGTKSRTSQQISEEIESIGGYIDTISGNNSFGVTVSVLSKHLDKGLDILADVLVNPTFNEEEVEKKRKDILAVIKQREDDPYSLAEKHLRQLLYSKHPYRFRVTGTLESIQKLTRSDLVSFYDKYCVPNNMVLAIFGDVKTPEVVEKVKKLFSEFRKKELVMPSLQGEEVPNTALSKELEKDIQQVVIYMGFLGPTIRDEDRYAVDVLDAILSGISLPGGRLHEKLRANKIVYVVHAYVQAGLEPGMFAIYAGTTMDKLDSALKMIRDEIESVRNNLVTDEELECGKRMCTSAKLIGLQTNASQAFISGLDELYGLGYDDIQHYEERIKGVTKEDVKRAANKYLQLDKCAMVIVKPSKKQ